MSEYSRSYCPTCKKRTDHESDECMVCLEKECKIWAAIQADGINDGSIVLSRNINTTWQLSIFTGIDVKEDQLFLEELPNQRRSFHMIAPWTGEHDHIGTTEDLLYAWDSEKIEEIK